MTRINEQNLWSIAFTPETVLLSPVVTDEGGLVMDARATSEPPIVGWHERWLLPDSDAVNTIWQHAREMGFDFEICELLDRSRIDATQPERQMITEPQREALELAYREGYFSEPREASLADLAASLDNSPSAVGGRVRRGMKTLIGRTLVINDPDG
jgi:Predicted DNA binding protein